MLRFSGRDGEIGTARVDESGEIACSTRGVLALVSGKRLGLGLSPRDAYEYFRDWSNGYISSREVVDPEEFGPEFRARADLSLLARATAESHAVLPENASPQQVVRALRRVSVDQAEACETALREALLRAAETLDLGEVDQLLRAARLKVVIAERWD